MKNEKVVVYDTTLRDGNQSYDVNFTTEDKLKLIEEFDRFGFDYIELGWPRIGSADMELCKLLKEKRFVSKIAVFGSTRKLKNKAEDDVLLKGLVDSGADAATIFGKAWIHHVEAQLKGTPDENLDAIYDSVNYLKNNSTHCVNEAIFDAEHYFDGYKNNYQYALDCLRKALSAGASCVVLCDTNGGMLPYEIFNIVKDTKTVLDKEFEGYSLGIHCHNDCGMAAASTMEALRAGVDHVQGTINGLGERTGNTDLCTVIPNIILKLDWFVNERLNSNLKDLTKLSRLVSTTAGISHQENLPFVGTKAFVHDGGVHVDAIMKGASYQFIDPEVVGNKMRVSLSSNSGKATAVFILKEMGFDTNDKEKVLEFLHVIHNIGKKGQSFGLLIDEYYYIARKIYGMDSHSVNISRAELSTHYLNGDIGKHDDTCLMDISINDSHYELLSRGKTGQVGVAHDVLKQALKKAGIKASFRLVDYSVTLPKNRAGAHSYTQTTITYEMDNGNKITTSGFDDNVIISSLLAMKKAAELIIEGYKQ